MLEKINYVVNYGVYFELAVEETPTQYFLEYGLLEHISRKSYISNKELEIILFNPPKKILEQGIWEPIAQGVAKRLLEAQIDVIFRMCLNASKNNPFWNADTPLPLTIQDYK